MLFHFSVSDTYNFVLRMVVSATGYISTIAGVAGKNSNTGEGTTPILGLSSDVYLSYNQHIAIDVLKDEIYVSDKNPNRIRKVFFRCNAGYNRTSYYLQNQCVPCPLGYFNAFTDKTCSICPTGSSTLNLGSLSCTCIAGYYNNGAECSQCQVGTFKPSFGDWPCTNCSSGYFQNMTGQSSCSAMCAAGTYSLMGFHACSDCEGLYKYCCLF